MPACCSRTVYDPDLPFSRVHPGVGPQLDTPVDGQHGGGCVPVPDELADSAKTSTDFIRRTV